LDASYKHPVVAVVGPTATGKTALGVELHPIQKALNIQPCAAHKDGQLLPGRDLFFQLSGHGGKRWA